MFKLFFTNIPTEIKPIFQKIENIWEVFPKLNNFLKEIIKPKINGIKIGDVYIDHDVFIGKGTIIEHGAMIKGPAFIGENCEIRNGAYIRGNVFIGDHSIIGHCSEVKNSILMEASHLGHFNYVGDSILGNNVNLGGGSILANLRFDHKIIKINRVKTKLDKLGSILGDNCQLGCNTVLNPGTIFKKGIIYSGKPLKSGIYDQKTVNIL